MQSPSPVLLSDFDRPHFASPVRAECMKCGAVSSHYEFRLLHVHVDCPWVGCCCCAEKPQIPYACQPCGTDASHGSGAPKALLTPLKNVIRLFRNFLSPLAYTILQDTQFVHVSPSEPPFRTQIPTVRALALPPVPRRLNSSPAPSRPMLGAIVSVSRNEWLPTTAIDHVRALGPLLADANPDLPNEDAPNAQHRPSCTHRPNREPTRATVTP